MFQHFLAKAVSMKDIRILNREIDSHDLKSDFQRFPASVLFHPGNVSFSMTITLR
jgi:hypothetical protein